MQLNHNFILILPQYNIRRIYINVSQSVRIHVQWGFSLKLHCGYKYTRSCMIYRIWGSETIITAGELSWLISFARAWHSCKEGKQAKKFKMKIYMSSSEIKPATLCFPSGHLACLAIGTIVYMRLKLFQNPVINNAWQYIHIWLWFCVFMQSLNVNSNK